MFDMATLGKQLRDLREQKGLGVRELARRLRKSHAQILKYENGAMEPRVHVLAEIAGELGMRYLDLVGFLLPQVPNGRVADFVQEKAVQLELPFEEDYAARIDCHRVGPQLVFTLAIGKTRKLAS